MKVRIDKFPTKPEECLFAKRLWGGCECIFNKQRCDDPMLCKYLKYDENVCENMVNKDADIINTPNDYTLAALRTLDINLTTGQRLMEGLIGMNSEAGEALDFWKKAEFQGHRLDEKAIALELGDVLWYLVEASDALGYSLEEIMKMNIEKLKKRYPNGFDPEKSKHREV